MGISGRLEDLSAADALQFFHMSARSGQLRFESGGQCAWLALRDGRITGASMPGAVPPLGNLLCQLAGVPQARIDHVAAQSAGSGKALGAALVESKLITTDQLRVALTQLIRSVVAEVLQWDHGTFSFEPGALEQTDDIEYVPEELLPDIAVDVQDVLLDALRSIDESSRDTEKHQALSVPASGAELRWSTHPEPITSAGLPILMSQSPSSSEPAPNRAADLAQAAAAQTASIQQRDSGRVLVESRENPLSVRSSEASKYVVLLTSDGFFRYGISSAWADAGFNLKLCGLEQEAGHGAAELLAGGADVVVVVHASGSDAWSSGAAMVRCIRRIKSLAPSVPILVIGRVDAETTRQAFRLGVRHVLQMPEFDRNMTAYLPQFQKFAAAMRDALSGTFEDLAGSETFTGGATSDIKRLAKKIEGLRLSTEKRAVALGLLEYVAENVERAIMFLVNREGGTAIGAFGSNGEVPLSDLMVGMKLSYKDAPVLRDVVEHGLSFRGPANPELIGCAELFARAGRPRTGHAVFLPVRGVTRVFAALYLDNGSRTVPLVSTEALQILSAHAGLMLENLALQRSAMGEARRKAQRSAAANAQDVEALAGLPPPSA